ncbi:hypothetical protein S1OALGB6SA_144 [Olavius algarvensis spirochete endosymbiont]|uniref:sulfotransferase family protein n=1 Tax=Olavius algarvensis spirochete endosymbiont TaxID=260710 RepID=UPI000F1877B8|nr:sulfotransferase [Olavius algarvensis spirochete endosymbiont]VDA99082.1 hypothetical protein S1OALGB6SA_144 [Olavius algarvensis spirochete endosymbiont]
MSVPFNWSLLLHQAWHSIFATRGTHRRLTPHRLRVLIIFWVLFIPHQIVTRICLALDNIFFSEWRKRAIKKPIFITGLFRSGTTYLHRMIASDVDTFSSFKTWEIYLAPSIVQRKLLHLLRRIDALIGQPMYRLLSHYNSGKLGDIRFHHVGLWEEEEDEGLFLFLWDSLFTWFFFPDARGMRDYWDTKGRRNKRSMEFFRDCVRRHLFFHGETAIYLSKNPAFTPMLANLKEVFPDARVIYLLRTPMEVLPSQAAWLSFCWHYFASPIEKYPFTAELLEMTAIWYSYPLKLFDSWQLQDFLVVKYTELIQSPIEMIEKIYKHFSLSMSESFRNRLQVKTRGTNRHSIGITLDEVGYDRQEVLHSFAELCRRFDLAD